MDIFLITIIMLLITTFIYKYDFFKTIQKKGIIEKDFSRCYIISYSRKAELYNKGEMYIIDLDDFFILNPKLKGKIPIEKIKNPLQPDDPEYFKRNIQEAQKIHAKYFNLYNSKAKK